MNGGPECPHGTKTLSADQRRWLCPSEVSPCGPEDVSPATAHYVANARTVREVPPRKRAEPTRDFSAVPVWEWQAAIRDAEDVTGKRQEVAFILSTYATPKTGRDVRPAASTVAKAAGVQRQNVYTHINGLAGDGWLAHYATHRGGVKVYALTIPER